MCAIVVFTASNETEYVPIKWLTENNIVSIIKLIKDRTSIKCFWPPLKNLNTIARMQDTCKDPETGWLTFSGRILTTAGR